MRALAIPFALAVLSASAPAPADEVAFEAPREQCPGPAAFDQIVTCLKAVGENPAIVTRPSAHSAIVGAERRLYVQRVDGRWQMMMRSLAPTQVLVGEVPLTGGGGRALRYELREQELIGRGLLRVKSAIVCAGDTCTQVVYACSFVENGRATSVLAGEAIDDGHGGVRVVADRSRAVGVCNR